MHEDSGGRIQARRTGALAHAARRAVFALDALLRRRLGIVEYSSHPECMLRAAIVPSPGDLLLADGCTVRRGRPVADLHLWNERVPPMGRRGADLAWLAVFDRRLRVSLAELAHYLAAHPELAAVQAVRIETAFGRAGADMERIGRRFGFAIVRHAAAGTAGARLHRFLADFLFLALTWAYNPASLGGKRFRRQHHEYWMSRTALETRYGAARREDRASARPQDPRRSLA
jgi:hypothetical protein